MRRSVRILGFILATGFTLFVVGIGVIVGAYLYVAPDQPDVEVLRDVALKEPMRVYTRDGRLIGEFGEERRRPLTYEQTPERMRQAFIAAEDDRFYQHPGVDYQGLIRAAINLVVTRERSQGGSTITMQLARNFFLTSERTYVRKISEIFLALKIERELSKEEVITLYLNKIYLGQSAYGVGAAAQVYYGVSADELTLAQVAMIAGLPKAPSRDNPIANPDRALERRAYVLGRMRALEMITESEYQEAVTAPITARRHTSTVEVEAPFVAEMVRQEMLERYGDEAYVGGYQVVTTVNSAQQPYAMEALRDGLLAYDKRHGWRGPVDRVVPPEDPADDEAWAATLVGRYTIGSLRPAAIAAVDEDGAEAVLMDGERVDVPFDTMSWARPFVTRARVGDPPESASEVVAPGDVVYLAEQDDSWALSQVPEVEGAVVAMDPASGAIRALAGGFDFDNSQYNRAIQAERQAGSAFKPFIYSAALENGFTPATLVNDAPVVFEDVALESVWRPQNYSQRFFGPTRLREALIKSRNLVSIRVLRAIGVDSAVDHLQQFGFRDDSLPRNLSLALGSGGVTPVELTRGFAVFANGGYRVEPWFIERIQDRDGRDLYLAQPAVVCGECSIAGNGDDSEAGEDQLGGPEWRPRLEGDELNPRQPLSYAPRVITPANAYLMNDMLREVVRRGTGRRAGQQLGRSDLAGKTGTANEYRDAWFSGFNPSLVATAWVGFDRSQSLGPAESGARAALPIWTDFMGAALLGEPERALEQPPGLVTVRISRETGLMVGADHPEAMFETFREGNLPPREDSDEQDEVRTEDLF